MSEPKAHYFGIPEAESEIEYVRAHPAEIVAELQELRCRLWRAQLDIESLKAELTGRGPDGEGN